MHSAAATTDEELIARYAAGEVAAFERLYGRHEGPLWRYLLRLTRDHASAEELMQDTWFAVAREAARFREDGHFAPWLYTIARRRVIDRHRMGRSTLSLQAADDDGEPLEQRLADPAAPSPQAESERMQQGEAILAALGRLPPVQRDAFLLQVEAGLAVEQIAQVTGTTFETAKSRLRYAREKLRVLLREYAR